MTDAVLDRRRVLALALATPLLGVSLAGCAGDDTGKAPPSGVPVDADARVRWTAIRAEQGLLALHAAVVAAHPGLAATLESLTAHHYKHLTAVDVNGQLPPGAAGVAEPVAPTVPADADGALAAVLDAERAAGDQHLAGCMAAAGPALAALLGSLAAAEAAHGRLLEGS